MFEEIIRKKIQEQREYIKMCEGALSFAMSEFMVMFWHDEIKKHEFAIDTLNGVLNLVSLTR